MYEKLEQCPLCKSKQFNNHLICDDYTVSHESFALVKCSKCSLIFTNPRPELDHLSKYYKSDQYISHTDKANSPLHFAYKAVRYYTLRQKTKLIKKYNDGIGSVLDYGSGTGDFINVCKKQGWNVKGYEPDEDARKIAEKKNEGCIISSIKDLKEEVDVITAWHVIEHVFDLRKTVKSLRKKLKEGGHLILALPNHQSYDAKQYSKYWAAYDVPRHLYHFDQKAMETFAKQFKFTIENILPMKFDAYYVSLLSEKYKKQKSFITALKTGYLSNKEAKKTTEYSSLIYILKK